MRTVRATIMQRGQDRGMKTTTMTRLMKTMVMAITITIRLLLLRV